MNTADLLRMLCEEKKISCAELARKIGQTPQNLNKKLKRNTLRTDELILIAKALDVNFEQSFSFPLGKKIGIFSYL